jgi:hypothetical protein
MKTPRLTSQGELSSVCLQPIFQRLQCEQPKTGPMPTNHRSGCNHDERPLPSCPESSQHDPEQLVQRSESMARSFGVQSNQLLAEG